MSALNGGKLLADFGADVIKIEPPGWGCATRAMAPHVGEVGGTERSQVFAYLYMTSRSHWVQLKQLMDHPPWLDEFDDDWLEFSVTPEKVETFHRGFPAWVKRQTKNAVADTAQRLGVPLVPVNGAADLRRSAQYRHRGFFRDVAHPVLGTAAYPTVPYRMSSSPVEITCPAPALGQHTAEVLTEIRPPRNTIERQVAATQTTEGLARWPVGRRARRRTHQGVGRSVCRQAAGIPGRRGDQGRERRHPPRKCVPTVAPTSTTLRSS